LHGHDDESDLTARGRTGDLDAFNVLVERYQRPLYNLCLRLLASPEAAEDATQEGLIHAFRSITPSAAAVSRPAFPNRANACHDEMRSSCARPALSLDEPRA
jgi:RNA polymerase sigma-70 factor (ECF subfamily)